MQQVCAKHGTRRHAPEHHVVGGMPGRDLGDQLWEQLGGQLRAQLWVQLGGQIRGQLGPWDDAYWLSMREAACRITGLESTLVDLLRAVRAATVTTWAPYADTVIICDRPDTRRVDPQTRLHADDGPALPYPDGCALWS